jgi:hypothetical protein
MPRKQVVYWRNTETDPWRTSGFSWSALFNMGDQRCGEEALTCRHLYDVDPLIVREICA